jgi:pyruvate dehydrogenase E2 component (dihydrolipoyllysine-residue acetyltransferase)
MIFELRMPRLDEDMVEGTVTRWLKEEGDPVQKGEITVEIETQKVNFAVEASGAGTLYLILANEGELVAINGLLGVIAESGDDLSLYRAAGEEKRKKEITCGGPLSPSPVLAKGPAEQERILISPLARKLAQEMGLDISRIRGTGPQGRITKEDVLNFRAVETEKPAGGRRRVRETLPLSGIRKAIADRMVESWQTAPRAENHLTVDVSELLRIRDRQGEEWEKKHGIKPTVNDVLIAVTAGALRAFPIVNASVRDGRIEVYEDINISMAVSLEKGLITPVVRQADQKSVFEIAQETRRLAELVRTGKHTLETLAGSTFTITNLGMFGVEFFVPILNPPESAILSAGQIEKKPVVIQDAIAIRSMMRLCLAYDHRLLDGVLAAKFLLEVKKGLEDCKPSFPGEGKKP